MYVEEETFAEAMEAPWHLDMLDGNFDGLFTSVGGGEGVDIYILDTGNTDSFIKVHCNTVN